MVEKNPFEDLDEDTQKKIQELQILEQNFHQLLMQKQTFNFEFNETELAIDELKKSDDEVFKIIGNQIIVKTSKDKLNQELVHKKELLELRLKNIEKQEEEFSKNLEELRDEIMKRISNK
ncbi:MAG: prefoldin subunit beta [Nanoarchaeota archaeon]